MNIAQRTKLGALIVAHTRAAVDNSWKGASPPDEAEAIEQHAKKCSKALNAELNALVTNDGERLNLLLDTVLAAANDIKLPPAGMLLMEAMQNHTAAGTVLTSDLMKGILDVALSTISIHPTAAKSKAAA